MAVYALAEGTFHVAGSPPRDDFGSFKFRSARSADGSLFESDPGASAGPPKEPPGPVRPPPVAPPPVRPIGSKELRPGDVVGGLRVDGEIGRGSCGVVYRARRVEDGHPFAVKILLPSAQGSESRLARFRREARMLRRLRHPGLVAVHADGEHDGVPWIALDLVEGHSLERHTDVLFGAGPDDPIGPRFDERIAAQLVIAIARAVEAAHQLGVVHRDLKPENVLVGRDGAPRVTDFGLAFDAGTETRITETGVVIGTPLYMSPEQACGERADVLSDVYAVGAILYRLLVGRPPFPGRTAGEVFEALDDFALVAPSEENAKVSPAIEAACIRAMDPSRDRRYQTAGAVADALARALAGGSVEEVRRVGGEPPPPPPKPARAGDGRPRSLGSWALAALAGLVVAGAIAAAVVRRGDPGAEGTGGVGSGSSVAGTGGDRPEVEPLDPKTRAALEAALEQARRAVARGDEAGALLALARAERIARTSPAPHRERARILLARGQVRDALAALGRACELARTDPEPFRMRAIVLLDHRRPADPEAALVDLARAAEIGAPDPAARLLEGRALLEAGDPIRAAGELAAAAAAASGDAALRGRANGWLAWAWLAAGRPQRAHAAADAALESTVGVGSEDLARLLHARARATIALGEPAGAARADLDAARQRWPNRVGVLDDRYHVLKRDGAEVEAASFARRIRGLLGRAPRDATTWLEEAVARERRGEIQEALAALAEALSLAPSSSAAFAQRAAILESRGRIAGALLDLARATTVEARTVAELHAAATRAVPGDERGAVGEELARAVAALEGDAAVGLGVAAWRCARVELPVGAADRAALATEALAAIDALPTGADGPIAGVTGYLEGARAFALHVAGRPDEAVRAMAAAEAAAEAAGPTGAYPAYWAGASAARAGRADEALAALARAADGGLRAAVPLREAPEWRALAERPELAEIRSRLR